MKTRITILSVESKQYPPRQGQTQGSTKYTCQCVVHTDPPQVGVLSLYDKFGVIPEAGDYMASFGVGVHWETKEIGGRLESLEQIPSKGSPFGNTSPAKSFKEPATA